MVARTTRRRLEPIPDRRFSIVVQPFCTVLATNSSTEVHRINLCLTAFDDLTSDSRDF